MDQPRKHTVQSVLFVPKSELGHRLSPLTHAGFGATGINPHQPAFSSSWLWQARGPSDLTPRFTIGFPEEYLALQKKENSEALLNSINVDLLVFRNLNASEINLLKLVLKEKSVNRAVLILNHLLNENELLNQLPTEEWLKSNQIFLTSLPGSNQHDAFFSEQELIWKIQGMKNNIPFYAIQVPNFEESFLSTFDTQVVAKKLSTKHPIFLRSLTAIQSVGLYNIVLFIQRLLAFFMRPQVLAFLIALAQIFKMEAYLHLFKRLYTRVWHKTLKPVATWVWFEGLWPIFNKIWFRFLKGSYRQYLVPFAQFLLNSSFVTFYHRFYRQILLRFSMLVYVLIWHQILRQIVFRKLVEIYVLFWHQILRQIVFRKLVHLYVIGWHRNFKPGLLFLIHNGLNLVKYRILLPLWILARYRSYEFLMMVGFPIRKLYWILEHEYEKRILKRFQRKDA